jgi:hypothetical protein
MVTIELILDEEEIKLDLPESWDEVTVEQFTKIMDLQEKIVGMPQLDASVKITNVLTKIPENIIWMMTPQDFGKIIESLTFLREEIQAPLKDSLMIDGEEYFVKNKFEDLTMGEIITIEQIQEETGGNVFKAMPKLLTLFLRKKNKKGNLEKFDVRFIQERMELFNKITITDVYTLFFSFTTGRGLYKNNMKDYSEDKPKRQRKNKTDLT